MQNKMYNYEQKESFIRDYTKSVYTAEIAHRLFNKISAFETEQNADISSWSIDVLQKSIEQILSLRKASWGMTLCILREYCRWCLKNKIPNANDNIYKIEVENFDKVRQQTVANPLQLQNYFDIIFNPVEANTIDNTFRGLYWMAYAGIIEKEAVNVKNKNIDFDLMRICLNDQQYPIYNQSIPVFKNLVNSNAFNFCHPLHTSIGLWKRVPGDILVRGLKSEGSIRSFRVGMERRSKEAQKNGETNLDLSYSRIWMSGMFYRIEEHRRAGLLSDFLDMAFDQLQGKNLNEETLNRTAKRYKEDYERWKLAYNI